MKLYAINSNEFLILAIMRIRNAFQQFLGQEIIIKFFLYTRTNCFFFVLKAPPRRIKEKSISVFKSSECDYTYLSLKAIPDLSNCIQPKGTCNFYGTNKAILSFKRQCCLCGFSSLMHSEICMYEMVFFFYIFSPDIHAHTNAVLLSECASRIRDNGLLRN